MEIQRSLRYRVNISTSVKGIKTWDCTVEGEGYNQDEILLLSDNLVYKLTQKYSPQKEENNGTKRTA